MTILEPSEDHQPGKSLMTERQLDLVRAALEIEETSAAERGAVGYAARLWAQMSLPYRDPGNEPVWVRKSGALTLSIRPSSIETADGWQAQYPFGVVPRYLMTWMTSEAVRTQQRTLHMGATMNEFIDKVGLSKGGAGQRRVMDQMKRLFGAALYVEDKRDVGTQWREAGQHLNIAKGYELFFSSRAASFQQPLFGSTVTLSEDFFESVISSPVPIDLDALRALAGSPMRLDLYTWLTYRLSYLRKPTLIPYELLALQFGSDFTSLRDFKKAFLRNLPAVLVIYPEAKVKEADTGIWLSPSPPHIAKTPKAVRP